MKLYDTQLIRIEHPLKDDQLLPAAKTLQAGGLVAFPTETVYGLGANALESTAVGAIFAAKGRPADNPLIIHVAKPEDIQDLVVETTDISMKLLESFSPGPLTLVLKRSSKVPDLVTAGLDTVAVRIPAHETARRLIELAGVPVAAPSANRSGRPSPTRAWHVFEDLNGLIPFIIDDGPCEYGLESTVLDLTGVKPVILRPGAITAAQIEQVIGQKVLVNSGLPTDQDIPKAPGMKYRHYAPKASVMIARGDNPQERAEAVCTIVSEALDRFDSRIIFGLFANSMTSALAINRVHEGIVPVNISSLSEGKNLDMFSSGKNLLVCLNYADKPDANPASEKLFTALRRFDQIGVDIIIAEALPLEGMGIAYMNRLDKAAGVKEQMKGDNMRICFVCTGNTCRSPMAEYLLKKYLQECGEVSICSAGIQAVGGDLPSPHSVQVMADNYALDINKHRAARVDASIMSESDYVFTMTQQHKYILQQMYPEYASKIETLGAAAGNPQIDIPDPFAGSIEEYQRTAQVIDDLTGKLADILKKKCK